MHSIKAKTEYTVVLKSYSDRPEPELNAILSKSCVELEPVLYDIIPNIHYTTMNSCLLKNICLSGKTGSHE
jgi:hypothetical protein